MCVFLFPACSFSGWVDGWLDVLLNASASPMTSENWQLLNNKNVFYRDCTHAVGATSICCCISGVGAEREREAEESKQNNDNLLLLSSFSHFLLLLLHCFTTIVNYMVNIHGHPYGCVCPSVCPSERLCSNTLMHTHSHPSSPFEMHAKYMSIANIAGITYGVFCGLKRAENCSFDSSRTNVCEESVCVCVCEQFVV